LPREAAHYVVDVLRLAEGAGVVLVDGAGRRAEATLVGRDQVEVAEVEVSPPLPAPRVSLVCALSKGDKLDTVVEKASELGAESVWPVVSLRSIVRLEGERAADRRERWERVAVAAARQCGRDHALRVEPVRPLEEALGLVEAQQKRVLVVGARPLTATLDPAAQSVALCTGPEGGLAEDEVALAGRHGWEGAGLGELVLRAETAPLAALAAVLAHAGRM
jgi:16S rRNA (uracil1498-N3)-methyltransferase